MKTIDAALDEVLLELGFAPATLAEPERRVIIGKMHDFENDVLQKTGVGLREFKLTLKAGVQEAFLPDEVFYIDNLKLNGTDITACRVQPNEITIL